MSLLSSGVHYSATVQAVSAVVAALASVGLLAVAVLLRDEVRAARRRPLLKLEFAPNSLDASPIGTAPYRSYWVRLRVHNSPGRDMAHGVQLLLLNRARLDEVADASNAVPSRPLQVSDTHELQVDIPSDVERRFDLIYVKRRGSSGTSLEQGAVLTIRPRSETGRDIVKPGRHRLILALVAENADATYWSVDLELCKVPEPAEDLTSLLIVQPPIRLAERPVV